MAEFILFMFDDASDKTTAASDAKWGAYLQRLRASGHFDGGSSIGQGVRIRRGRPDEPAPGSINGFIRVRAEDAAAAREFLVGNPVFEAGGTVEICELTTDE